MKEPGAKREASAARVDGYGAKHLPELYSELRRLAASKLAREKPGQPLQATALVREAFMRLEKYGKEMNWRDERHYFSAVAESMRRILIDKARAKNSQRRGGERLRVEFRESSVAVETSDDEILAVDGALEGMAAGFVFRNSDGRVYLSRAVDLPTLRNCIHYDIPMWNEQAFSAVS